MNVVQSNLSISLMLNKIKNYHYYIILVCNVLLKQSIYRCVVVRVKAAVGYFLDRVS